MDLNLTQEQLDAIGATDNADLAAKLQLAYQKGSAVENIEKIGQAMLDNSEKMTDFMKSLSETKRTEVDAEAFEAAARSKALETFNSLPADDPQRAAIRKSFEAELGLGTAEVLLTGDAFTRALQAPISTKSADYGDKKAMRKAFDKLMIYCAGKDALRASKTDPEKLVIDKSVLQHGYNVLKSAGVDGIEMLEKGINAAMDTQTAGEGLEWVPSQILSRNLYEDIWLDLLVPDQFQRFKTTGNTLSVPARGATRPRLYGMDESVDPSDWLTIKATPHTFATRKIDFAIKKAAVLQMSSMEFVDDSIVPVLDEIYADIVYGAVDGIEDAVINGSRATNDLDNAAADTHRRWANSVDQGDGIRLATGAKDARYLWNGIHKKVNAGATVSSTSFGRNELLDLRTKMGKYGVNPADLFLIVSPQTYIQMLKFPEVATLDKYGAQAAVLRGEHARLDNIPILVSPRVYTNLDDSGKFTDGTVVSGSAGVKTKTHVLLVHKRAYAFADRMTVRVESEYQMMSQQRAIQATMRLDFQKMMISTENTEANLINLTA